MNVNKLAFLAILGTATTAAMGQGLSGRIFSYDGSNGTNGLATYQVNGDGVGANVFSGYIAGTTFGQNGVSGATYTNAAFLAQTLINVSTYVYISGNFGAVYTVSGFGAGTDPLTDSHDVEIRTNRSLSFSASGFYAPNNGSITYSIALFQDYPSNGFQVGPTLTAVDGGFNGATLNLNLQYRLPDIADPVQQLMEKSSRLSMDPNQLSAITDSVAASLHWVFIVAAVISVFALAAGRLIPAGERPKGEAQREGG